jgi:predicted helicase
LAFVAKGEIPWQALTPDAEHTWLVLEHTIEYREFAVLEDLFQLHTAGLQTNRDETVYDWHKDRLIARIEQFVADYNTEVHRHHADPEAGWPDHIKWSSRLKQALSGGQLVDYDDGKVRQALYRPFGKTWLYFDGILNHRVYQWPKISGRVIWVKVGSAWPFFVLMSDLKNLRSSAARRLAVFPPLPPQRLRRRTIPPALRRRLAHQGASLPLPLRPAAPSRLPRALRRQSQTRIAANSVRPGF